MNKLACMNVCTRLCVHGDICVRVWWLHDSQCHNFEQKRLDILSGNHSHRSCIFLRHPLSQRVTWLDPQIGSERGSSSSILSSIPISALRFTWSRASRPSPSVTRCGCKTTVEELAEAGTGLRLRVKRLGSWHAGLVNTIDVGVECSDWSSVFLHSW